MFIIGLTASEFIELTTAATAVFEAIVAQRRKKCCLVVVGESKQAEGRRFAGTGRVANCQLNSHWHFKFFTQQFTSVYEHGICKAATSEYI